jgi:hypothetical protein
MLSIIKKYYIIHTTLDRNYYNIIDFKFRLGNKIDINQIENFLIANNKNMSTISLINLDNISIPVLCAYYNDIDTWNFLHNDHKQICLLHNNNIIYYAIIGRSFKFLINYILTTSKYMKKNNSVFKLCSELGYNISYFMNENGKTIDSLQNITMNKLICIIDNLFYINNIEILNNTLKYIPNHLLLNIINKIIHTDSRNFQHYNIIKHICKYKKENTYNNILFNITYHLNNYIYHAIINNLPIPTITDVIGEITKINVFDNINLFETSHYKPDCLIIFDKKNLNTNVLSINNKEIFIKLFNKITLNQFANIDTSNMLIIGECINACIDPLSYDYTKNDFNIEWQKSDIDICYYNINRKYVYIKIINLYQALIKTYPDIPIIVTCNRQNIIFTRNDTRFKKIRIMGVYDSINNVLNNIDIDCSCFCYNFKDIYCQYRTIQSMNTRLNTINKLYYGIRGCPFYEKNLYKYSLKGYSVIDLLLNKNIRDFIDLEEPIHNLPINLTYETMDDNTNTLIKCIFYYSNNFFKWNYITEYDRKYYKCHNFKKYSYNDSNNDDQYDSDNNDDINDDNNNDNNDSNNDDQYDSDNNDDINDDNNNDNNDNNDDQYDSDNNDDINDDNNNDNNDNNDNNNKYNIFNNGMFEKIFKITGPFEQLFFAIEERIEDNNIENNNNDNDYRFCVNDDDKSKKNWVKNNFKKYNKILFKLLNGKNIEKYNKYINDRYLKKFNKIYPIDSLFTNESIKKIKYEYDINKMQYRVKTDPLLCGIYLLLIMEKYNFVANKIVTSDYKFWHDNSDCHYMRHAYNLNKEIDIDLNNIKNTIKIIKDNLDFRKTHIPYNTPNIYYDIPLNKI